MKMKTKVVEGMWLLFLVIWLNSATGTQGCPATCICYSEPLPTVACQQQGLLAIPTEIPGRSQRIFLQRNRLTVVRSTSFSSCRNLTVLWLYSNNISHIEAGAFYGLERLEELDIGDNVLTGETMEPLVSLQYLRLNGNQWMCDCRARTLWDWFKRFKGSSSEIECYLPERLAGKDLKRLKSSDLEGCVDDTYQVHTSIFSTKTGSGEFYSTESPLREGIPRCCLLDSDKSSIISNRGHLDPSSYNSRQITNNPLKEKENILKTKFPEVDPTKNSTHNKYSLNDGPVGTFSNNLDQSLGKLKPGLTDSLEPSTAPPRKKKRCSKKPKSDPQCLKGKGSSTQALSLLVLPVFWLFLVMC
ncbi:reticulon-4 receptor isoform X3 [Scleropages formosus]|uniref:reticulon-4 receptor isoform X3 n=1 Tax=Scleropages formosus TaxID=113540 RepID=UPI0008789CFF|nr:reticulon-4 receptor isoform X3 [Scleropages formosus]